MIFRKSSGSPTDISCAREGALDKATYVASHRSSCEKKRGNFPWKMRPGFARRHKRFGRILRGVVFSRFRINGRMVARRCCLTYSWPMGPTKNARCEDSGQKKRRDSSLLSLSAVYMQTCICRRKRSCCQPTSLGALEGFLGVSRGLEEPGSLVMRQAVTRCWIWYFGIVTALRGWGS